MGAQLQLLAIGFVAGIVTAILVQAMARKLRRAIHIYRVIKERAGGAL